MTEEQKAHQEKLAHSKAEEEKHIKAKAATEKKANDEHMHRLGDYRNVLVDMLDKGVKAFELYTSTTPDKVDDAVAFVLRLGVNYLKGGQMTDAKADDVANQIRDRLKDAIKK